MTDNEPAKAYTKGESTTSSIDLATCPELSTFREFLSSYRHPSFPSSDAKTAPEVCLHDLAIVEPDQVPQPYRDLLIHRRNMTPTLERYFGSPASLVVLKQNEDVPGIVTRWILLEVEDRRNTSNPSTSLDTPRRRFVAELSTIRIHLKHIPECLHDEIRRGSAPLGTLLLRERVNQQPNPHFFVKVNVKAGTSIALALRETTDAVHYLRTNTLTGDGGCVIAQVVEMLPCFTEQDKQALFENNTR